MLLNFDHALLIVLAAAVWLLFGGILAGPRYPVIRRRAADATTAGADALDRVAETAYATRNGWAGCLLGAIRAIGARFVKPASASEPKIVDPPRDLPPIVLACFSAVLLAAACATNYALLSDILPELAGVAPSDRVFPRLGWWIAITSPAVIIGGEAVGGLLGIRYSAGRQLFLGCLVFEILAALRRAADYAFESSLDAGHIVSISPVGAVQGATFVALAVLLPIVIYKTGAVLEPALRALSGQAAVKAIGRWLSLILRNLPQALAIAGIVVALVVVAIGLTIVGFIMSALAWIVRYVVHLIVVTLLAIVIGFPAFIVGRVLEIFRRPAVAPSTMLLLALVPFAAACSTAPGQAMPESVSFGTVTLSSRAAALRPDDLLSIPSHRLATELVRLSPVKKVHAPTLFVCVVDATGSVPVSQRDRMLRSCAHRVALLSPETTGAVVLVGGAGWSSEMPVVWRPSTMASTHCEMDPPLPQVDAPTMLYARAMRRAVQHIDDLVKRCNQEVAGERERAGTAFAASETSFVNQVVARLGGHAYGSTDLFGTLSRIDDLESATEDVHGALVRIDIELLSDLFDSANGCFFDEIDPLSVQFVCASPAVGAAQQFLKRPDVHARFFQVVSSDPVIRRTSQRWRTFWSSFAPDVTVTTWSEFGPPAMSASGR